MVTHSKSLPADERRAVTVESVAEVVGSKNPNEITTAANVEHLNVTQGALFRYFRNQKGIWPSVTEWVAEYPGVPRIRCDELQMSLFARDAQHKRPDVSRVFVIYRFGVGRKQ